LNCITRMDRARTRTCRPDRSRRPQRWPHRRLHRSRGHPNCRARAAGPALYGRDLPMATCDSAVDYVKIYSFISVSFLSPFASAAAFVVCVSLFSCPPPVHLCLPLSDYESSHDAAPPACRCLDASSSSPFAATHKNKSRCKIKFGRSGQAVLLQHCTTR
jgi:hypothetical protein